MSQPKRSSDQMMPFEGNLRIKTGSGKTQITIPSEFYSALEHAVKEGCLNKMVSRDIKQPPLDLLEVRGDLFIYGNPNVTTVNKKGETEYEYGYYVVVNPKKGWAVVCFDRNGGASNFNDQKAQGIRVYRKVADQSDELLGTVNFKNIEQFFQSLKAQYSPDQEANLDVFFKVLFAGKPHETKAATSAKGLPNFPVNVWDNRNLPIEERDCIRAMEVAARHGFTCEKKWNSFHDTLKAILAKHPGIKRVYYCEANDDRVWGTGTKTYEDTLQCIMRAAEGDLEPSETFPGGNYMGHILSKYDFTKSHAQYMEEYQKHPVVISFSDDMAGRDNRDLQDMPSRKLPRSYHDATGKWEEMDVRASKCEGADGGAGI